MVKLGIIGCGYYGCIAAEEYKDIFDIVMFEKEKEIMSMSSFYNQNREHEGFHYCRNRKTRLLCKEGKEKFRQRYPNLVADNNGYYVVSKNSILCFETIEMIFRTDGLDFEICKDDRITEIYPKIFRVNEGVILSQKAKEYFTEILKDVEIRTETEVLSIIQVEDGVLINGEKFDYVLDCTYGQLSNENSEYIYENTLSLIYNKVEEFPSVTIIDGNFGSIYPMNESEKFTLTDVEFTPLISSEIFDDVKNYVLTPEKLEETKLKMEEKICTYIPRFREIFIYEGYFTSFKTKQKSGSSSRDITIHNHGRILSVNCGKIFGVFEWLNYLEHYFNEKILRI